MCRTHPVLSAGGAGIPELELELSTAATAELAAEVVVRVGLVELEAAAEEADPAAEVAAGPNWAAAREASSKVVRSDLSAILNGSQSDDGVERRGEKL